MPDVRMVINAQVRPFRAYCELICARPKEDRYSGIRVVKGKQALMNVNGKPVDSIEYTVTCFGLFRQHPVAAVGNSWESLLVERICGFNTVKY